MPEQPKYTGEAELILICSQYPIESCKYGRIKYLLQTRLQWDYIISISSRHGVTPLLCWNLRTNFPEYVPQNVLTHLFKKFYNNTVRNHALIGELLRILDLLELNDISAVAYKGPAMAEYLYRHVALRESSDLDILIKRSDLDRARSILESLGYRLEWELTDKQEELHLEERHDFKFISEESRIAVELHWKFTSRKFFMDFDMNLVWDDLTQMNLAGSTVNQIPVDILLVVLCNHLAVHCFLETHRLKWISDIGQIIRDGNIETSNWCRAVALAEKSGSRRALLFGVSLASDLFEIELPLSVSSTLQADSAAVQLAQVIRDSLFPEQYTRLSTAEISIKRLEFYYTLRERIRERSCLILDYALNKLKPSGRDIDIVKNLPYSGCLSYMVRPVRLLLQYGSIFMRNKPRLQ